jgi:putative flippase GtrA
MRKISIVVPVYFIENFKKLIHYGFNGILNTIVTYGLFLILINAIDYRISIVLAYIPGIFLSYFLNLRYVFKSEGKILNFFLIMSSMIITNILITWSLVEFVQIEKEIAQIIAILLVFLLGFYFNKRFAFFVNVKIK